MANVVHFNMIVDINQLWKEKGIEYSIHAIGACTCNGLELRQDGKEYPIDEIIEYMNEYLDKKWMRVRKAKTMNIFLMWNQSLIMKNEKENVYESI